MLIELLISEILDHLHGKMLLLCIRHVWFSYEIFFFKHTKHPHMDPCDFLNKVQRLYESIFFALKRIH